MPTNDKIFEVATEFYDELHKLSKKEEVNGETFDIFRGSMTKVWDRVSNSQSYYVPVMGFLRDFGYLTLLQRGTRGRESVVAFHSRPLREHLDEADLTTASPLAKMQAEIDKVSERLGGLDIVEALKNHEGRLKKLEQEAANKKERKNGKTTK